MWIPVMLYIAADKDLQECQKIKNMSLGYVPKSVIQEWSSADQLEQEARDAYGDELIKSH